MATLPDLKKGVVKDPDPPTADTQVAPISILPGTILVTTKTTNETIDNVDQLIDYVSGDNDPNFIPQNAIDNLVFDLAAKEDSLGFTPENIINKVTFVGTPGNDTNYPTEKSVRDGLDLKENSLGFTPEDSANKGAISGYAGLDASQELLLTNFPDGDPLQLLRRNAQNDGLEFITFPPNGVITSINGNGVSAQTIDTGTGLGIVDVGPVHTLSIDATVATLADSQVLTNKTITAAANTLTIASTDLTDTADIAYLNTANAYIAGVRQDFLGLAVGTAGLNVGGIGGNPTTQVNGDIWLNTSTNQIFARINGANVDLGASGGATSFIGFTADDELDMGEFDIVNVGTLRLKKDNVGAFLELEANHTTPAQGQTIGNVDWYDDDSIGTRSLYAELNVQIADPTSGSLDAAMIFRVKESNVTTSYMQFNLSSSALIEMLKSVDMGGNAITFSADVSSPPADSLMWMGNEFGAFWFNAPTGSEFDFAINGTAMVAVKINRLDLGNTTDILGALNIQFGNSEINPDGFLRYIQYGTTQGFRINAAAADITTITFDGNARFTFSDTNMLFAGGMNLLMNGNGANGYLELDQITDPANALSNHGRLYVKNVSNDVHLFLKDDTGIVTDFNLKVTGPGGATDNAIARFDTATGILIQNSGIIIDDSDNITGVVGLTSTGALLATGTMRIPLAAAPTMAVDGDFAIDTTITDFSHGLIKYFDGEELALVALPVAELTTPAGGDVVTYNATNDEFELIPPGAGEFNGPYTADTSLDRYDFDLMGVIKFTNVVRVDASAGDWALWVDDSLAPDTFLWNVPTGMEHALSYNGVIGYTWSLTQFDMLGKQLINAAFIEVESSTLPLIRFNRTAAAVGTGNAGNLEFRSGNQIYGQIRVDPTNVGVGDETGTMVLRVASNSFENDFITLTGSTGGAAFSTITFNQMMGGLIDMNSNLINNISELRSDGTIAATGFFRIANGEIFAWRNNANSQDHSITFDSNDEFIIAINGGSDYRFSDSVFDMINNSIEQLLHIQDATQNEQLAFTSIASAINHLQITNAAIGTGPIFAAIGDDTDVDLEIRVKGDGVITFADTDGNEETLELVQVTGTAVNYVQILNSLTGVGPTISAVGANADVDLNLISKGTGTINLLADANFTGDLVMGGRFQENQGADIVGASTITLGDGNYFNITGNTDIDFMTTTGWQAGSVVVLQFDANSGANDNTMTPPANTAAFALAGNFSSSAGDTLTVVFDGTFWREISRSVN